MEQSSQQLLISSPTSTTTAATAAATANMKNEDEEEYHQQRLQALAYMANNALEMYGKDVLKTFHARVGVVVSSSTTTPPNSSSSSAGQEKKNSDDAFSSSSYNEQLKFQQKHLRLGLLYTKSKTNDSSSSSRNSNSNSNESLIATIPYNDNDGTSLALVPSTATNIVYKDILPLGYDGWTGDVGLLALLLLNEMARSSYNNSSSSTVGDAAAGATTATAGIDLPKRTKEVQTLLATWIATLPSYEEMQLLHPLLWNDRQQEILQYSSTKKIYRLLDDIDDDSSWLVDNIWSKDRLTYPETVMICISDDSNTSIDNDEKEQQQQQQQQQRPCFSPAGFKYAISIVRSRSFYVDGSLRLLPYLDYANHNDNDTYEIRGGNIAIDGGGGGLNLWGMKTKGAQLLVPSSKSSTLQIGDEICISYGPKGPVDYLLDHGFVPPMCRTCSNSSSGGSRDGSGSAAVTAELTFEVDDTDRFRDDKLDILEHETYDLAPMDPIQSFDVAGGAGLTGEPDPAMMQFVRLCCLNGKDAFLLESIFRRDVWGYMSEPVSEENERGAVKAIIEACQNALSDILLPEVANREKEEETEECDSCSSEMMDWLCLIVRESERDALTRTLAYMKQEAEALDLKEYYQERRLKSLGLDSDWTPEDDFGGTRLPGTANYDW
jgi:[ribulose-bisphosphate carboxylase]-lysine N-methyltransferase